MTQETIERTKATIEGEKLNEGGGTEIRGFGSFGIKGYKSYTGRNPKTGAEIQVAPKKLPFFRVGKELKERVNTGVD